GWSPSRSWAEARGCAIVRSSSATCRAFQGTSRPRDDAIEAPFAAEPVPVSDGVSRYRCGKSARAARVSRRPLLGAGRSRAPRGRGARQARSQRRNARARGSHRAPREPTRFSARRPLGGPLAWARAHHAARCPARDRLRPQQLSEAPSLEPSLARPVLVGALLRAFRTVRRRSHSRRGAPRPACSRASSRLSSYPSSRDLASALGLASARAPERLREATRRAVTHSSGKAPETSSAGHIRRTSEEDEAVDVYSSSFAKKAVACFWDEPPPSGKRSTSLRNRRKRGHEHAVVAPFSSSSASPFSLRLPT